MQNSKRESTGNGTAPLTGSAPSPNVAGAAEVAGTAGYLTGNGRTPPRSQAPPAENPAYKKLRLEAPPIRKPGQAPHRAAGTFPGVTTTYEPGYEKPSASPRESYWTC